MNPAITFDPLCPDCGHEMMDIYGKWECLNPECGTIELKAPLDNGESHVTQGGDTNEKMQRVSGEGSCEHDRDQIIGQEHPDHTKGGEIPPSLNELKAPYSADAVTEVEMYKGHSTAVTPRQDKESGATVKQKGVSAKHM